VEFRAGTITAFDPVSWTCTVQIAGAVETVVEGVPVAWHVRQDLPAEGVRCLLALVDPFSSASYVVVALYGGRPADDPQFDPEIGHDHSGMLRRGPRLPAGSLL